jgi:signal transduction histidine kinase
MNAAQSLVTSPAGDLAFMAAIPRRPKPGRGASLVPPHAIIPFSADAPMSSYRNVERQNAKLALLSRSAEWRSRMMAVAGHDLRQPLQVIARALERLGVHATNADDRKWLDIAFEQIDRITEGLSDLAMASQQMDPSLDQPNLGAVSMHEVFQEIDRSWRLIAAAKGLQLRIAPCSAWVLSDRAMLMTILNNLVGNAIKYTERGVVLVGCRRSGDSLRIAVIDTGRGMQADDLDRAFNAFEQIDPSQEGLGLGLWLVGSCCRALAHGLEVSSRPGRGSRFLLTTPMATPCLGGA